MNLYVANLAICQHMPELEDVGLLVECTTHFLSNF